jgi:hypothetical protein
VEFRPDNGDNRREQERPWAVKAKVALPPSRAAKAQLEGGASVALDWGARRRR